MSRDKKVIAFQALIKKIEVKSLLSLDKSCHVLLEFNANDKDVIKALVDLQEPDQEVKVAIAK